MGLIWWLWVGYWILLGVVMHLPRPPGGFLVRRIGDVVAHGAVYFLLAMLGGWSALRRGRRLDAAWGLTWLAIYTVYGAADELLQPLSNRSCEFSDWLGDLAGAGLAQLVLVWLTGRRAATGALPQPNEPA
ncbi:MAG: VanZ family protein [Planctomycetes bacterium]|nr:VanZ family protein [Planctomycetota bacterium]